MGELGRKFLPPKNWGLQRSAERRQRLEILLERKITRGVRQTGRGNLIPIGDNVFERYTLRRKKGTRVR